LGHRNCDFLEGIIPAESKTQGGGCCKRLRVLEEAKGVVRGREYFKRLRVIYMNEAENILRD
jgi:hypothetical protein